MVEMNWSDQREKDDGIPIEQEELKADGKELIEEVKSCLSCKENINFDCPIYIEIILMLPSQNCIKDDEYCSLFEREVNNE